jgi:hypothetical protein
MCVFLCNISIIVFVKRENIRICDIFSCTLCLMWQLSCFGARCKQTHFICLGYHSRVTHQEDILLLLFLLFDLPRQMLRGV